MYSKKYILKNVEEFNRHNPVYDDMLGDICYLAYLKVGEHGWFLHQTKDQFDLPHRINTSVVEDVDYTSDNRVIVTTQNTRFTFEAI